MCVQYIGGCTVHRRDTMSTLGDIMVHVGKQIHKSLDLYWKPRCTEHSLMYSWYPPICIMTSPHMHHGILPMYWTSPNVLMITPPMYWTSPNVLMVPPHMHYGNLPMYWTFPDVLIISPNMHYDIPPMYWTSLHVLNIPDVLYRVSICCVHLGENGYNHFLVVWRNVVQKQPSGQSVSSLTPSKPEAVPWNSWCLFSTQ